MLLGIGVTTHNRPEELAKTIQAIQQHTPNSHIIVVDDGSTPPATVPDGVELVRHDTAQGIPAAKNACLNALMRGGGEHFFLFDDDTRPALGGWWKPYVESPEPHLQYSWTHFAVDGKAVPKMDVVFEDDQTRAYGWSMGCMLYATRTVVETVGGMHWGFGQGMEEHAEWSQRIHNAGFTTHIHQDIAEHHGLIWAGDEHYAVKRSLPPSDRRALLKRNQLLREALKDSAEFVPYWRETGTAVITCYFNGHGDPQRRGRQWPAATTGIIPLLNSLPSTWQAVVLNDCLPDAPLYFRVETQHMAYRQRWTSYLEWMEANPDVQWVWCVDATDVQLLREPQGMVRGMIYCGWEPKPVGIPWMRKHATEVLPWIDDHQDEMLLNCGVVGGSRATMMALCRRMVQLFDDHDATPLHEMAFFNIAVREQPHKTGPTVTTVFKAEETAKANTWSWWKHK